MKIKFTHILLLFLLLHEHSFLKCNGVQKVVEKPFVIIICSYNNKSWYKKNLDAIFMQKYNNYRVIYIDDCSTDGTADLVESRVKELGQMRRFTLIRNKEHKLKMYNMYQTIHNFCKNHEIVMEYDGDDWLAHENVLAIFNKIYTKQNIWVAYSQHQEWPTNKIGWGKKVPSYIIKDGLFRKWRGFLSQVRTFYAGLFKKIRKEDLLCMTPPHKGQFYPTNADVAMMYPMLEMAGNRFAFLPQVFYIYNVYNPLNDNRNNREIMRKIFAEIKHRKRYKKLKEAPF